MTTSLPKSTQRPITISASGVPSFPCEYTRKLLEAASTLTDKELDRPLETAMEILPWREKTDTLRQLLENIVYTKEVWAAALTGGQAEITNRDRILNLPIIITSLLEVDSMSCQGN